MRLALKIAYDGSKFHGYARQPSLRTVEGEIIKKLTKIGAINGTRQSNFGSASRTDKGVSAIGNVVAFNTSHSIDGIISSLNKLSDLWIWSFAVADEDFNPRLAKMRWYRYYLLRKSLDIEKMRNAAKFFIGEHNFTNFSKNDGKNPVRKIDIFSIKEIKEGRKFLIVDVMARNFLWNQVRRMVSAIEKVGSGMDSSEIVEALENPLKKCDFGLARANGLVLMDVEYEQIEFNALPIVEEIEEIIANHELISLIFNQMIGRIKRK
jgi:tRNA pseudouridine38-40 synthase